MQSMRKIQTIATALLVASLASGCATSPDFGDALEARGAEATSIAKDFSKGEKLVAAGERDIRQGGKLVRKGENLVNDGEDRVRKGEALMAEAREAYCQQVGYQAPECQ